MKFLSILFIISNTLFSQERDISSYLFKNFSYNNDTLSYRLLKPYRKTKENVPLLIFLHGSGERGNNNKSQLIHGGNYFLKETENKKFNSYVIFPQCKKNSRWSNHKIDPWVSSNLYDETLLSNHSEMLVQLIFYLLEEFNIDTKKIYIMGLSMGGYGTFDLTSKRPDIFAGAISICGGANLSILDRAASVPHWIFHGELDRVVPVEKSRQAFELLSKLNSHHLYTEYKNTYHNSWENVFAEGDFMDWLFSKSL